MDTLPFKYLLVARTGEERIHNKLPIFKVQAQARVRSNKSREGEEEGTSHEGRGCS
jgi:hypothetical protein